jgi:capsular polysaccharide export protein
MRQKALIHVDGPNRAAFFGALVRGLPDEAQLTCTFVTESDTAHRVLKGQGHQVHVLKGCRQAPNAASDALYTASLCGALGNLNRRVAAGYKAEIDQILADLQPDILWCWNGTKFIDRCLKASGLPFRALEVANIPGHFVVETGGVNAESNTYDLLVRQEAPVSAPSDFDYETWQADYIEGKEEQKTIPQASVAKAEAKEKLRHLLGVFRTTPRFILFQLDRIVGYALRKPIQSIIGRLGASRSMDGTKVFFPQQVSSDSQLIFNADYDNMSAMRMLLSELPKDAVLISNQHPAEHRLSQKLAFLKICLGNPRLVPAAGGAWQHLKAADQIVTINSTVGLEAAVLNKPCRFLGKSVFARLNRDPEALQWFLGTHILPNAAALEAPTSPDLIKRLRHDTSE